MAVHRAPQNAGRWQRRALVFAPPILAVIVAAVVAAVLLVDGSGKGPLLDDDLCPAEDAPPSGHVALLLDLRKPLDQQGRRLLGDALRSVTTSMSAGAELGVYALTDSAAVARQRIDRICKPYDNAELADGAAGGTEGGDRMARQPRDCDDLPAQLPADLRDNATRFCARRTALRQRIERLVVAPSQGEAGSAYLVEAIEETSLVFAETALPRSLYIFSDMAQHAPWYSHWELGTSSWSYDEFKRLRAEQIATAGPRPPSLDGVAVTVFYLPRQGVTDQPSPKTIHKGFWRDYLVDAFGTTPVFHDQPVMPMYEYTPLTNRLSAAEIMAQERQRVQEERQEAERLLEQIEKDLAALAEARIAADEEQKRLERAAELRRQQAELEAQAAQALAAQQAAEAEAVEEPAPASESLAANNEPAPSIAGDASVAQSPSTPPAVGAETASVPAGAGDEADALEQLAAAADRVPNAAPADPTVPIRPPAANVEQALSGMVADPSSDAGRTEIGAADLAPCPIQLRPRYRDMTPTYPPGRARYATASIVVRYVVDDQGDTVDADVSVVTEQSIATPPRFLRLFGESATDLVKLWEYDFQGTEDVACTKRQQLTTRLEFRYR